MSLSLEDNALVDDLARRLGYGLLSLASTAKVMGHKSWEGVYYYVHDLPSSDSGSVVTRQVLKSLLLEGPQLDEWPELTELLGRFQAEQFGRSLKGDSHD